MHSLLNRIKYICNFPLPRHVDYLEHLNYFTSLLLPFMLFLSVILILHIPKPLQDIIIIVQYNQYSFIFFFILTVSGVLHFFLSAIVLLKALLASLPLTRFFFSDRNTDRSTPLASYSPCPLSSFLTFSLQTSLPPGEKYVFFFLNPSTQQLSTGPGIYFCLKFNKLRYCGVPPLSGIVQHQEGKKNPPSSYGAYILVGSHKINTPMWLPAHLPLSARQILQHGIHVVESVGIIAVVFNG